MDRMAASSSTAELKKFQPAAPKAKAPQAIEYCTACDSLKIRPNSTLWQELEIGTPLRVVDLSKNYIGSDEGFQCILNWIPTCKTLEEVDLSNNFLTTDNIKALVELLLREETNIHTLKLHYNRLYIESGQQLVRLARFNRKLVEIEVRDDPPAAAPADGNPPAVTAAGMKLSTHANRIPDRFLRQMRTHLEHNKQQKAKANQQA